MTPSHPFTRDDLLGCARRELNIRRELAVIAVDLGQKTQVEAERDIAQQEAIVAVLESYPLASVARDAVRVVFADLELRRGFDDLIRSIPDMAAIKEAIEQKLARTVVYIQPAKKEETAELEFAP